MLVTSEAMPLAKTGGLGDAVSGLARALREAAVDATVLMPAYQSALDGAADLRQVAELRGLAGGDATVWAGWMAGTDTPVLLLRNDALYLRAGNPYLDEHGRDFADNGIRFAALAQAAKRISVGETPIRVPHIVHAHDWHAGLTPLYLHAAGAKRPKSVLTIHNLAFQGHFPLHLADDLDIPGAYRGPDGVEFWGNLNFMKAGLRFADRITTVSGNYAREILTPGFGHGLDGLLRVRAHELHAIPNGVDTDIWNPASDPFLSRHFSIDDMRGKVGNKLELQAAFGLPTDPEAPLLAMGSRLTTQKMADVAVQVLPQLLASHPRLQIVVLGCGERAIESAMAALAERHPRNLAVHIGYDERRAHLLHAGADMLLHGSRFEPFGLTPLYSMLYGTVPIASRVGGLADTIADAPPPRVPVGRACGVLFDGDAPADMVAAVERTLDLFAQPQIWAALQKNGMSARFGWAEAAAQYVDLYRVLAPVAPVGAPMVAPRPLVDATPVAVSERKRA